MKLAALALLALLAGSAAHAQPLPVGSGVIRFTEQLKIARGCHAYSGAGVLVFTVFPNGSFLAENDAFSLRGALLPADSRGRSWWLQLDALSLLLYRLYLEAGASVLCRTRVSIPSETIALESFLLKLDRQGTQISLELKTSAPGASALGTGHGQHRIKGKGAFALGLLPSSPDSGIRGTLAYGRVTDLRLD